MPASEVMPKFKKGKLHSGSKKGPVVKSKKQATAIQISEARDEGYNIPEKKSAEKKPGKKKKKAKMPMGLHG